MKTQIYLSGIVLCLYLLSSCSGEDDQTPTPPSEMKAVPCENGMAGIYPCNGYDLQSHLTLAELGFSGTSGNDNWGWTDPETNKEYALVGTTAGTAFVDITDPISPVVLGKLPTKSKASSWRDIKVYNNHAFIVADRDFENKTHPHGVQIFDLTKLRSVTNPPITFTEDANFQEIQTAHNIVINEFKGYAYVTGTIRDDDYNGGVTFVDIQNPKAPVTAGGYGEDGYSHDAQVVTYSGPDTEHTGKEIYIGSNENEIVIIDVTDKTAPIQLSKLNYDNFKYTHQGWFTEDQKYFLLGDELDELETGVNTRTIVFDLSDLDSPVVHMEYEGSTAAIDHNGYIKGNIFYQACYSAGVRMIDISGIENKTMTEVGFFDTYPVNNNASFKGTWNVYPYFPSGNIIVNNIEDGLFVIKKSAN